MEFILPAGLLLVLSSVSPLLVQYLTNRAWSKNTKVLLAVGISIVIAVVFGLVSGDIALAFTSIDAFFASAVPAVGVAFAIQQAVFNTMFKGTELADKLEGTGVTESNPEIEGNGYGEDLSVVDENEIEAGDEVIVLEQD